jgi:RNA polymerase sigma-70 factor, ECF subfamily
MGEETAEERELKILMTQYQNANVTSLEELIRRVSPLLIRYFGAANVGRNDPEDLLQDCWLRLHRSRHTYRASEPFLPWMYAIARHTRLDAYRKRRRREAREVLVENLPDIAAQEVANPRHDQESWAQLVAGLPESQREVIVMLKVAGMSLQEVANATSSTVGAVKQKAHRAYLNLREALRKESENA